MTDQPPVRLCKDCRHIVRIDKTVRFAVCAATETIDLVSGDLVKSYASDARTSGQPCGPEGNLWEQAT